MSMDKSTNPAAERSTIEAAERSPKRPRMGSAQKANIAKYARTLISPVQVLDLSELPRSGDSESVSRASRVKPAGLGISPAQADEKGRAPVPPSLRPAREGGGESPATQAQPVAAASAGLVVLPGGFYMSQPAQAPQQAPQGPPPATSVQHIHPPAVTRQSSAEQHAYTTVMQQQAGPTTGTKQLSGPSNVPERMPTGPAIRPASQRLQQSQSAVPVAQASMPQASAMLQGQRPQQALFVHAGSAARPQASMPHSWPAALPSTQSQLPLRPLMHHQLRPSSPMMRPATRPSQPMPASQSMRPMTGLPIPSLQRPGPQQQQRQATGSPHHQPDGGAAARTLHSKIVEFRQAGKAAPEPEIHGGQMASILSPSAREQWMTIFNKHPRLQYQLQAEEVARFLAKECSPDMLEDFGDPIGYMAELLQPLIGKGAVWQFYLHCFINLLKGASQPRHPSITGLPESALAKSRVQPTVPSSQARPPVQSSQVQPPVLRPQSQPPVPNSHAQPPLPLPQAPSNMAPSPILTQLLQAGPKGSQAQVLQGVAGARTDTLPSATSSAQHLALAQAVQGKATGLAMPSSGPISLQAIPASAPALQTALPQPSAPNLTTAAAVQKSTAPLQTGGTLQVPVSNPIASQGAPPIIAGCGSVSPLMPPVVPRQQSQMAAIAPSQSSLEQGKEQAASSQDDTRAQSPSLDKDGIKKRRLVRPPDLVNSMLRVHIKQRLPPITPESPQFKEFAAIHAKELALIVDEAYERIPAALTHERFKDRKAVAHKLQETYRNKWTRVRNLQKEGRYKPEQSLVSRASEEPDSGHEVAAAEQPASTALAQQYTPQPPSAMPQTTSIAAAAVQPSKPIQLRSAHLEKNESVTDIAHPNTSVQPETALQ